jgi:ABC-type branched-subunit amino acid transport system substrate-binding protein
MIHLLNSLSQRTRIRVCSALAVAVSLCTMVECTVITSETNGQCHSDADCRSRGPAFASTRCSAVATCEVVTVPDVAVDGGSACETNAQCNAALSAPARCANNRCIALTNTNCPSVNGDPTAPDAMFVGVMTPLTGVNGQFGLNQAAVIKTAAAEWNASIGKTPNTHPVVTINCDELADPGGTATFLATRVGVPVIFGPIYDGNFAKAVPAANLNGAILAGPRADDPTLSKLPGIGKTIWSWAPNRAFQARMLNDVISAITPSVRTTQAIPVGTDLKLALLVATGEDTSSANFAAAVVPTLTFNGKSVAANGTNYKRVDVPFSFSTANKYADALAALVAAKPDVVIVTQEYDLAALAVAIGNGWSGAPFPRWVFLRDDPAADSQVFAKNQRLAGRLDILAWSISAREQQNAATFAVSYRSATSADPAPSSELFYDAFYSSAYAIQGVLAGNGGSLATLDPGAFAGALLGLNAPGTALDVGPGGGSPNNIATALSALAAKGDLDLEGASGPLEFDKPSGSPVQNAELRCIKAGASTVAVSGVTFDGKTGTGTGTYSCL